MTSAGKLKEPAMLVLQRGPGTAYGTHGTLSVDGGERLCYTLEEPWKDNEPRVSCIPPGRYQVIRHGWEPDSPVKFKRVWHVLNVPGRDAILIHAGNTIADTMGCILVGLGVNEQGITQSQAALEKLRLLLPERGFTLEVRGA
jgi:hypothetical protein